MDQRRINFDEIAELVFLLKGCKTSEEMNALLAQENVFERAKEQEYFSDKRKFIEKQRNLFQDLCFKMGINLDNFKVQKKYSFSEENAKQVARILVHLTKTTMGKNIRKGVFNTEEAESYLKSIKKIIEETMRENEKSIQEINTQLSDFYRNTQWPDDFLKRTMNQKIIEDIHEFYMEKGYFVFLLFRKIECI